MHMFSFYSKDSGNQDFTVFPIYNTVKDHYLIFLFQIDVRSVNGNTFEIVI